MNRGSDNQGSSPVDDRERRELREAFGHNYLRIQTGIHGVGLNRKQRRRLRYRRPG